MKKFFLPFVVAPAILLILLTVLRAYLEIHTPGGTLTKLVSVNAIAALWMLVTPPIMLKCGLSLVQGLVSAVVFFVVHRSAIGAVYAMAWTDKWTIDGSDTPVRYVEQTTKDMGADAETMQVFLSMTFLPVPFGVAMVFVVWCIAYVISFRGRRKFAAAGEPQG